MLNSKIRFGQKQKARELATRFGYAEVPADRVRWFSGNTEYSNWAEQTLRQRDYRNQLLHGQPSVVNFFYAQSPEYMVPLSADGNVTANDPPRIPGWVDLQLDPQARLTFFRAMPRRDSAGAPSSAFDWSKLFEAAGLNPSGWTPTEPRELPSMPFDERKAWAGTYLDLPQMPLRIEAASWRGKPVSFEMFGPWHVEGAPAPGPSAEVPVRPWVRNAMIAVILTVLLGGLLFALRNLRTNRGDLHGAVRLATYILVCQTIYGLLAIHHTPSADEGLRLIARLSTALGAGALGWTLYMAVEPYVRRHWPQVLIGWTRVLAGDFRNPMVAGHILVGITTGVGMALLFSAEDAAGGILRIVSPPPEMKDLIASLFASVSVVPTLALGSFFLFLLLRLILRRAWLVGVVVVGLVTASNLSSNRSNISILVVLFAMTALSLYLVVSVRFGLLAFAVTLAAVGSVGRYPPPSDVSSWFAAAPLAQTALILAIAVWCFRNALGGRKVWKGDILES